MYRYISNHIDSPYYSRAPHFEFPLSCIWMESRSAATSAIFYLRIFIIVFFSPVCFSFITASICPLMHLPRMYFESASTDNDEWSSVLKCPTCDFSSIESDWIGLPFPVTWFCYRLSLILVVYKSRWTCPQQITRKGRGSHRRCQEYYSLLGYDDRNFVDTKRRVGRNPEKYMQHVPLKHHTQLISLKTVIFKLCQSELLELLLHNRDVLASNLDLQSSCYSGIVPYSISVILP
jgi:hypothetical protein